MRVSVVLLFRWCVVCVCFLLFSWFHEHEVGKADSVLQVFGASYVEILARRSPVSRANHPAHGDR